jgi:hypothetical protein
MLICLVFPLGAVVALEGFGRRSVDALRGSPRAACCAGALRGDAPALSFSGMGRFRMEVDPPPNMKEPVVPLLGEIAADCVLL